MRRAAALLLAAGCVPAATAPPAPEAAPAPSWAFVVAGRAVPVDVPVVRFDEPGGYDAYDRGPGARATGFRYRPGRAADGEPVFGTAFDEAREEVDLLVVHYDACGTSRRCFEVLHSERGLSAHFLLDVDGTVYQTLDLADTAWHAGPVNGRSVGVEIAHPGAFGPEAGQPGWTRDGDGWRADLPPDGGGVRTPGFVARPARAEAVAGVVQGRELVQLDFTDAQYEALARLTAALVETFPRLEARVPRARDGRVAPAALDEAERDAFRGIVAHWHVGSHKVDPGPAFDWERYLAAARR